MMGGRKYSEEVYEVDREMDLRLNLEAQYIRSLWGTKIDSFPAFADIAISPDPTPIKLEPQHIWVHYYV